MRKGRIIFWIVALVLCTFVIIFCKREENKIPEEEKTPLNVYCLEMFQPQIKNIIEKSSIGDTHRVVFSDKKDDAEFILTDKVLASDSNYEKVGWSPLIVAFDERKEKKKAYKKEGYLIEEDSCYTIKFDKIIKDTISGKWKDKIYCPKLDTIEGEIFFDFLLININEGRYPINAVEMKEATEKANEFLNCNNVVPVNAVERLTNKKDVQDELYIIFENNIYDMSSSEYDFEISYPSNTACYEIYCMYQGEKEKELRKIMEKEDFWISETKLEIVITDNKIRCKNHTERYNRDYYSASDGFSYVEVPFKEE